MVVFFPCFQGVELGSLPILIRTHTISAEEAAAYQAHSFFVPTHAAHIATNPTDLDYRIVSFDS